MAPRLYRRAAAHALLVIALLPALPLHGAGAASERVQVQRALDGDSLQLRDGREVRLIGINTPEFDQPFATTARDRTNALVRGQILRLDYDAERFDRYGRTLAYAVLGDGRDVQELLLREGLAWFVAIPPNVAHLARYRAAEMQARQSGRGVWADTAYAPVPAARVSRHHTGFLRLAGTVQAVAVRGSTVTLRLNERVHLALPAADDAFPRPARMLLGKRVLARGWLTEYKNGLRMRITHPAMLELLQ